MHGIDVWLALAKNIVPSFHFWRKYFGNLSMKDLLLALRFQSRTVIECVIRGRFQTGTFGSFVKKR